MEPPHKRLKHDDCTVACICPMGVELAAVKGMLDDTYPSLPSRRSTVNYLLGRIGEHNIIIAVMPGTGNNRAAQIAIQLLNDFPSIRFGLLVGIGGGVPSEIYDIRLGDVVVSKPTDTFGGVVQYELGKQIVGGQFQRTGSLKKPPCMLLAAVQQLEAKHRMEESEVPAHLAKMLEKYPKMKRGGYTFLGAEEDVLFDLNYIHEAGDTCSACDQNRLVNRRPRDDSTPEIIYGTIGSGNTVIKDETTREKLRRDLGILCVEMEAAGLMDEYPCLVIRGICDYADSHKNKRWQPYAAATATAYMKELLSIIPAAQIEASKAIDANDIITTLKNHYDHHSADLRAHVDMQVLKIDQKPDLSKLPTAGDAAFDSHADEHDARCLPGTRVELLENIKKWAAAPHSQSIFWLNGVAGTGKSTISRTVAQSFADNGVLSASFFFKRGERDRGNAALLFTTIAARLANIPSLATQIRDAIDADPDLPRKALKEQFEHLIIKPLGNFEGGPISPKTIVFVIDALDECERDDDVRVIIRLLSQARTLSSVRLRTFVTSRPELPIRLGFSNIKGKYQDLVLHKIPKPTIEHDIAVFMKYKLKEIRDQYNGLSSSDRQLPSNWPDIEAIRTLVQMAVPLFIFAATICLFIKDDPASRLNEVLNYHSMTEHD